MPKLSIIIPVYNAAATLGPAVESIGAEEELEILLIEDASADNSAALCRKLAQNDRRIRAIYDAHPRLREIDRELRSTAARARTTIYRSRPSSILERRRRPAVSVKMNLP